MLLNQQLNAYEHVHLDVLDGIASKHKYMEVYVLSLFKSLQ